MRPDPRSSRAAAGPEAAAHPADAATPERTQRERPYDGRPFILGTIHPATNEIRELAETLGLRIVVEVYQPRQRAHPGAFFGKGRLGALRTDLDEWRAGIQPSGWVPQRDHWIATGGHGGEDHEGESDGARQGSGEDDSAWGGTAWTDRRPAPPEDGRNRRRRKQALPDWRDDVLMILDEDVRPAVLFNLEERLGIEVWDRTRLILEIFSQHAHVKEAQLQVELAKLQYEIPLIHEAVHRRRSGERPGFRGGGEYGVADYEDFIKRRMRTVKDELEHIRQERDVRRKVRRERFYLVSLAGYTNAGKSSLLNALTGAGTLSEDTLFSTLATTTRRMRDPGPEAGETPLHRVEGTGGHGGEAGAHGSTARGVDFAAGGPSATGAETQPGTGEAGRPDRSSRSGSRVEAGGETGSQAETAGRAGSKRETRVAAAPAAEARVQPEAGAPAQSGTEPAEATGPGASPYQRPVLLTDTVGFIQALPSWLLDAFHSTLEEIALSDVVLLVADVSDPVEVLVEKVRVCRRELAFMDVTCPIVLVLNKSDLVPEPALRARMVRLESEQLARPDLTVVASSLTSAGIPTLVDRIHRALPDMIPFEAAIQNDNSGQRLVSRLYQWGSVSRIDYGTKIQVKGECDPLYWKLLVRESLASKARIARS